MSDTSIIITTLLIILLVVGIVAIIYSIYTLRKINKLNEKCSFLIEDITHKSELLNPPMESLKKLCNYIDGFDLLVKNNLKSGLSLLRRNSYLSYKLIENLKNLFSDESDFKTTPRKKNKE